MQAEASRPEVRQVAAAIRSYLEENPKAADTAEGIQRWWLAPQFGEVSLQTVEAALAQLESEGWVCKLEQSWSDRAYSRCTDRPEPG
jgi:Fe2+ or Zn2+ uptake regulation protein